MPLLYDLHSRNLSNNLSPERHFIIMTLSIILLLAIVLLSFAAGLLLGWRSAVRKILFENEDLFIRLEDPQ